MRSTFDASRIFNDQDGWYVIMRTSDRHHLTGYKHKFVGNQHMMGPFLSKHKVEDWLESYLAMYAEKRHSDKFIPDNIDTHH